MFTADWLKLTADDMPDGAVIHLRSDDFDFKPYVIYTPIVGALRLPIRHYDSVGLEPDGTMLDTLELRLLGVRIGKLVMRLRPT